ncbi:PREDICTED: uncharacterized protein LOC108568659 [Nicrophorus vespilloides]|uniref:Uncharacterized protein LOC108568659 n=1 Tax=Nicrophorus vespilloides TaxID=110193 RepID=A0ABM1NEV5_NICVS|nr:PREDICTED: uncharacterized protein LOC108568659 [Nicrophorus vespilloides]
MSMKRVSIVGATELGEGPHWDQRTQSLYYVDIFGQTINKYTPATESHSKAKLDENVTFIIPKDGEPDKFIITVGSKIVEIEWNGISPDVKILKTLTEMDSKRINDGKCDPRGRLWFGTIGVDPVNSEAKSEMGSLFCLDLMGNISMHVSNVMISNGLTWNADRTKFYYIDSMKFTIDEFDYDDVTGHIGNGRPIFSLKLNKIEGMPDGMTIDSDGNLWVAIFQGYQVIQIDPRKPETILQTVKLPAKMVTSVAWGGSNLDELYVTTANFKIDNEVLDAKDGHGGLFVFKGLGARGITMNNCKYITTHWFRIKRVDSLYCRSFNMQIQQLHNAGATELGEGPHWDQQTQSLYYVDIFEKTINKYTPATESHSKAQLDEHVSVIIPKDREPHKFIVTMNRKIVEIEWDGVNPCVKILKTLAEVDNESSVNTNRINDGKCDPHGRLWFGTMGEEPINGQIAPNKGSLFSLDSRGNVSKHVTNIWISNGLSWNADRTKFYYIDSVRFSIDEFDYDDETGQIGSRKAIFSLIANNIEGFPDGMTIDSDGNLWVAIFNGFQLIQIDPSKPETLLKSIKLPAKQVTSVAWGGANLDELYVTSGKFTVNNVVLDAKEGHGGLFVIKGLGVRGLPMTNCKL